MSRLAAFSFFAVLMLTGSTAFAQDKLGESASAARQTETDEYTRYELLAPETNSFRIRYEVTATTPGARYYYNPIRKGSIASDEAVFDQMTGKSLPFGIVSGAGARKDPLMADADADTNYIKVQLARPVPPNGQGRILILKTYKDPKSYFLDGEAIVFSRSLSIKRNSVTLPPGYELVGCNFPSQVLTEPDGRTGVSFMNAGPGEANLVIRARTGAQTGKAAAPRSLTTSLSWESPFPGEPEKSRLSERAHQDRDIVYLLQQPETHAFSLYHDYTESRPGTDKYLNIVRGGSTVSNPSAYLLDTGEPLTTKILKGDELAAGNIETEEPVTPTTQVVVITFSPVKKGESLRLRISETYTAPASYGLAADELVFDRSLGRPRNAVVLPDGWYLTATSIPATVSQLPDGRVRLDYWNPRPDSIDVLIKAKRRSNNKP